MSSPLVSIIIPTYNRVHLISETLDSVKTQTYTNWECIVVDDGSNDGTEDLLNIYVKNDSRFRYYKRPANLLKGANACRNYGFEKSKGEFVNWFDDDDIMLSDFLKVKVNQFSNKLKFVICSGYYFKSGTRDKKPIEIYRSNNIYKDYCLWKLKVLTPSVLFRKEFLLGKKLFLLHILRGQETELFSRLFFKLNKEDYTIVNSHQFLYRQHEKSKTGRNVNYETHKISGVLYIYKENFIRSMYLKDEELISYYFKRLVSLWYNALRNKDYKMTRSIKKNILSVLETDNFLTALKIRAVFFVSFYFNLDSFRLRQYLKSIKINV